MSEWASIFDVADGRFLPVTLEIPETPFAVHVAADWSVSVRRGGKHDDALTAVMFRRHCGALMNRELLHRVGHELREIAHEEARGLRIAGVTKSGWIVWTSGPRPPPIEITSREQAVEMYGREGGAMWDEHVGTLVEMRCLVFRPGGSRSERTDDETEGS